MFTSFRFLLNALIHVYEVNYFCLESELEHIYATPMSTNSASSTQSSTTSTHINTNQNSQLSSGMRPSAQSATSSIVSSNLIPTKHMDKLDVSRPSSSNVLPREKLRKKKIHTNRSSSTYKPRTNVEFQQLPLLKGFPTFPRFFMHLFSIYASCYFFWFSLSYSMIFERFMNQIIRSFQGCRLQKLFSINSQWP